MLLFDRKSARDKPALVWEMQVKDYYRLCFALVDNSSVYNSALDILKSSEVLQNKSGFNWYT